MRIQRVLGVVDLIGRTLNGHFQFVTYLADLCQQWIVEAVDISVPLLFTLVNNKSLSERTHQENVNAYRPFIEKNAT